MSSLNSSLPSSDNKATSPLRPTSQKQTSLTPSSLQPHPLPTPNPPLANPAAGTEKRIARRAAGDMCTTLGCVLSAAEQAAGFGTCAACRAMKGRGRMRQRGLYAAQGRCRTRGCPLGPGDRGYVQCASCREVGMERLRMWKKVGKMRSGVGGAASS
ncbi:hypothetical protein MCOR02_003742 [Pyricularia oryzae]|uniref:Uncharacterized protein n=1 Tax=Pyricularia oryzae TaxID=318829 RepID=A0A4P7MY60_PYROR|nr:hypothetical protein MCOR02_003742 [Pyricularia oryzae]KAI6507496.1 hypothetical protein MCOR13_002832 [Pyricularia oryzae]QBZ54949.1 hypothetical protein PoMZ_10662 [Pyricularia oryzae]